MDTLSNVDGMQWWDWVILISGLVAAAGTAAALWWSWWTQQVSTAAIMIYEDEENIAIEFSASGSLALHHPTVEVIVEGQVPITLDRDRNVLRAEDAPLKMYLPPDSKISWASIQWTEHNSRRPKIRGLSFDPNSRNMWRFSKSRGWVPLTKRQIARLRNNHPQ